MKKFIACALIFVMCMAGFAGCGKDEPAADNANALTDAKNYLYTMYKDQNEATPTDYTVVGVVNIGGTTYNVTWTADHASVKIVPGDNKMVTIDVDDQNPEEVTYVLTATLKDEAGNTESCSFTRRVPAAIIIDEGMSYAEIVDAAYALEKNLSMDGTFRLYGTVTKIDTAWSEEYKNISVVIAVAGKEDKPILCYRLKGDGAKDLAVGDAITVEGSFKNYEGTIEFDAGCVLVGYGEHKDYTAILDAIYTLEDGVYMGGSKEEIYTLTGVVDSFKYTYSPEYDTIQLTMIVGGITDKPIVCYKLGGTGIEKVAIGDTIVVSGPIKNYKGTYEFDGCTIEYLHQAAGAATETPAPTEAPVETPAPTEAPNASVGVTYNTQEEIVAALYELAEGQYLGGSKDNTYTLTGVITNVKYTYSEQYGNGQVTIQVGELADKPVVCYKIAGDNAVRINGTDVKEGTTITVTGPLKNYKGTFEFDGCNLDAVGETGTSAPTEAPAETAAAEVVVDLTTGLTAGENYNGFSVLENMAWKEGAVEIDGVSYAGSVAGTNNPSPKKGEIPTEGAAVVVAPAANGTLTVIFKLNNGKTYHVVSSDGIDLMTETNDSGENTYITKNIEVEAGKTYYIYGDGTKLPFYFLGLK